MVPCPKMNCKETVIFKDLVDQHLKQAHSNEVISIYYGTEKNEYTHKPEIFGVYNMQDGLINGRNYYEKGKFGTWFMPSRGEWMIGLSSQKGETTGFAIVKKDIPFLDSTTDWKWLLWVRPDWIKANKGLGVKGITLEFILLQSLLLA